MKKIFVVCLPDQGHVLPVASVIQELIAKNPDLKVIFYGINENESIIRKTGAEYRKLNHIYWPDNSKPRLIKKKMSAFVELCYDIYPFCDAVLPQLIADFETEKPDLILYDTLALHAKYMLNAIENRYRKKISSLKPPLAINFSTTFAQKEGIYPTDKELIRIVTYDYDIWYYLYFIYFFIVQLWLNWRHNMTIFNMPRVLLDQTEKLVLTTVYPEFQPKAYRFDQSFKFVGSCVADKVRKIEIQDEKLTQVMSSFEPVNPLQSADLIDKKKKFLVLASLGTTFNNNLPLFETIIDSFRLMCQEKDSIVGANDLTVVVATGKDMYNQIQEKVKQGVYTLPENLLLQTYVPQLELLQRANLFITHAGMNSASEAIKFGVPVVCLP